MKHKNVSEDDGRVIANMNIEGTPWYVDHKNKPEVSSPIPVDLTRKESFFLVKGALTAGLIIGFIFVLAFLGFILFCTKVWLR